MSSALNTATDLELMTLVAAACGGVVSPGDTKRRIGPTWDEWEWIGPVGVALPTGIVFHPLYDNGNAFVLAVMLRISLEMDALIEVGYDGVDGEYEYGVEAWVVTEDATSVVVKQIYGSNDPLYVTRRAIVLVAAELGKRKL